MAAANVSITAEQVAAFLERPGVEAVLDNGTWAHPKNKQSKDGGVVYRGFHFRDPATGETMKIRNVSFKNAPFLGIYNKRKKKEALSISIVLNGEAPLIFRIYPKIAPLLNTLLQKLSEANAISPQWKDKKMTVMTNTQYDEETGQNKVFEHMTLFYSFKFPKDNSSPNAKSFTKASRVVVANGISKVEEVLITRGNIESVFPSGSTRLLMGKLSACEFTTSSMGIYPTLGLSDLVMGPAQMRVDRAAEAVAALDAEELAAMASVEDHAPANPLANQGGANQGLADEKKEGEPGEVDAFAAAEAQLAALSAK